MAFVPQEAPTGENSDQLPQTSEFFWKSHDGLTLAGREWPASHNANEANKTPIPVLCLPGLSRNTRDFNEISNFLQRKGHRVIALDYRGRGKSDWDPDWQNYALPIEEKDIDAAIDHLKLERFALFGTSRGGLHALVLGLRYPADRMAAVVFNDIGPHIEMRAIHRIAATLGHNMSCATLDGIAETLTRTLGPQFPVFGKDDWLKMAAQLASKHDGSFVMDYDPALARQFASLDDAAPVPDLWPLYDNLTDRPVLILRGEHSDLLSAETCKRMIDMHPNSQLKTIKGQGHAPVLWETDTHETIAEFLSSI
ncbi:acyl-CoA esterase [Labrenzia sp. THAF82]|uniref:alpha/beta fold hydrolase n=1 Tax=Labrenzia sp. THAF82 TaxID=2587861 RepID=UPI0012680EEB|nr:alpha/beta hydrolase [Labrenzia sp. THAF82]QFT32928.1 acyl-CoA esterase [Labrenzia sp. THAF82]